MSLGPTLSHIALVSRDVDRTALVLETLGLARQVVKVPEAGEVPAFAVGEVVLLLAPPGHRLVEGRDRPGVDHLGFRRADPGAAAASLAAKGIGTLGKVTAGPGGIRQVALDQADLAGVRAVLCEPLVVERAAPGMIERIDHVGIASADNQVAIAAFCGKLGLVLESRQTDMEVAIAVESFTSDKYGVVYHTRSPVPVGGLRVAFITAGDCELEFLENFDPAQGAEMRSGSAGTTRQDQGAITRFIATRGAGLHHIAFKTADIDATLERLRHAGIALIDAVGRPGSRRALIGFLHPAGAGGVLLHLAQRPSGGSAL